jgi:glyoxylase-like metal-dependent hydrolase (beta-lactamase superfamily II)
VKIGNIDVSPVIDGSILSRLPASKPLPDPGTMAWQEQHGMFKTGGLIESTIGGFLVRVGDRLALVDAGSGQPFPGGYSPPVIDLADGDDPIVSALRSRGATDEHLSRMASDLACVQLVQGGLPASLSAIGVHPEDVTDLIFTHLHFDHIGWASEDGHPFFRNATVRCAAADLDYFLGDGSEEKFTSYMYRALTASERLAPVLERMETWEADGTVLPGIDVRLAAGHTPGSTVVVISDGSERAMLLGDIIHCPLELMDDDFNLLVDHDQKLANQVRESYARELEGARVPVAASHFPGLHFGRLLPGEGVRRWTFSNDD